MRLTDGGMRDGIVSCGDCDCDIDKCAMHCFVDYIIDSDLGDRKRIDSGTGYPYYSFPLMTRQNSARADVIFIGMLKNVETVREMCINRGEKPR